MHINKWSPPIGRSSENATAAACLGDLVELSYSGLARLLLASERGEIRKKKRCWWCRRRRRWWWYWYIYTYIYIHASSLHLFVTSSLLPYFCLPSIVWFLSVFYFFFIFFLPTRLSAVDDWIPQAMKDAGSCDMQHHLQIFETCCFLERGRRSSTQVGSKYVSKCWIVQLTGIDFFLFPCVSMKGKCKKPVTRSSCSCIFAWRVDAETLGGANCRIYLWRIRDYWQTNHQRATINVIASEGKEKRSGIRRCRYPSAKWMNELSFLSISPFRCV